MTTNTKRTIRIEEPALKRNDHIAGQLRQLYAEHKMLVINMLSSPGSGKTELLKKTALRINGRVRVAVVVGDLATENDAIRIREAGITAIQIVTGDVCHLDSEMVLKAVSQLQLDEIDILFIENVGNLVCPSSFDLGEDKRVVLLSCTEGEDKPLKYPSMFATANMVVVNKCDISEILEFDINEALNNIRASSPGSKTVLTSAKTGAGVDEWIDWLTSELGQKRGNLCK